MLHGAATPGSETFDRQVPALSTGFRVHLPDARGHGRTRWDVADGFRASWLVDDVLAFVDGLGLSTFHLVGYSMGAMTALELATRAPDRLRTLVVVGITTEREPRARVAARLLDPERVLREDPAWAAALARAHDPVQGAGAWAPLLAGDRRRRRRSSRSLRRPTCARSTPRRSSRVAIAIRSSRSPRRRHSPARSGTAGCWWRPMPATTSSTSRPTSSTRRSWASIVRPRRSPARVPTHQWRCPDDDPARALPPAGGRR